MDFSKTYYKTKNYKNKIQLELSKTNFSNFNFNNKLRKNTFNYGYLNSFSKDNKLFKTSPQNENAITNEMIKTIGKFKPSKSTKDKIINKHLKNFHTEIIKLKIRKNRQYRSLFDNIDISSPSENVFQSPQLKKIQKKLINLKLKSNKMKIFNQIFGNNINSINYNNSGGESKTKNIKYVKASSFMFDIDNKNINNKLKNHKLLADDISRTHFTTKYFSSFINNKSPEKNISSFSKNNNYTNTDINTSNKIYEKKNDIKFKDKKKDYDKNFFIQNDNNNVNFDTRINTNINLNNINENKNIIINDNNKNINTLNALNTLNTLNTFSNNTQSFITSINYIQPPPCVVEFREQNLHNFYEQTRDLRYIKYFLYLNKNKLKNAKEKKELTTALQNIDLLKLIHFYKLFKPYNYYLEKYILFLKDEINIEYKNNQKLKILKNKLVSEVSEDRRNLLGIHKRLKEYLNDKYFLLCVKNTTLNLDLFDEKDKIEFGHDLRNFEILKKYLNELSKIDFNQTFLGSNRKKSTINHYLQNKKLTNSNYSKKNTKKKSIIIGKNSEKYLINIFNNSRIHFKPRPIFESIDEFNDYMQKSKNKIESLLMEDNKIGIEVSNLRDYYTLHLEDINKIKYNKFLLQNQFNKLNQELSYIKVYNTKLMIYKNKLLQNKKNKAYITINKKLATIINAIFQYNNENINKIIVNNKFDKPILVLKDLENVIIYLMNFKNDQKQNNMVLYNEILKEIDKNKRLAIIKEKKKEDENRIEKKYQEIIEKDLKILNINNRRINKKYKFSQSEKRKKKENVDEEKNSVDISY